MFSFRDVQNEIGERNRSGWEQVWNDLLQSEAPGAGLDITDIHFDERTEVKDGGRDIVVKRGASNKTPLLPTVPSIWSVKSGKDGTSPTTLSNEVKKHRAIQKLLNEKGGYIYCLCFPADHDQRTKLDQRARELEKELALAGDAIVIQYDNHLVEALKRHPGVLRRHCPKLGEGFGYSRDQWGKLGPPLFDPRVRFVEIDNRRPIIAALTAHLRSAAAPAVLHIAGLSGVGKTRLVYEACLASGLQASILY